MDNEREIALCVAMSFLGKPYLWAGRTPVFGFDCSGLVAECLRSVGLLERNEDLNSEGLRAKFEHMKSKPVVGGLLFWDWQNEGRARHVEMIISITGSGELYTIGAADGDRTVKNPARADIRRAFVKIRPARPDAMLCVDPFSDLDSVVLSPSKIWDCAACEG